MKDNISIPTTHEVEIPLEAQQISVQVPIIHQMEIPLKSQQIILPVKKTHHETMPRQSQQVNNSQPVPINVPAPDSNERLKIIGWFVKVNEYKPLTSEERPGLIKKICSIMICQLMLTTIMCIVSQASFAYREFQLEYTFVLYIAQGLVILLWIIMLIVPKISRRVPYNYILLLLFTICEGYIISHLCSLVHNNHGEDGGFSIIIVSTFTLGSVVGLTIFTFVKSKDFKAKEAISCIIFVDLLLFGIMAGIYYDKAVKMIFPLICAIILGLYIIGDFQLIVDGQTHQLSVDDYILGSALIYLDIICLFITTLMYALAILLCCCHR